MESPSSVPVHCIVPARMRSSRFPGKPLAMLCGKPMVVRTLERARSAQCFGRVVCATDSSEIAQVAIHAGFEAVMTPECVSGSDRVCHAAALLNLDLVVNLQGDEPVVGLTVLRRVADALRQDPACWVTACASLADEDRDRPSAVKVQVVNGFAVDFRRKGLYDTADWFLHRGIYAYSAESREQFRALPPSPAELEHSLEQMRVLGLRPIRVVRDPDIGASVDLPSDVKLVENIIKESCL